MEPEFAQFDFWLGEWDLNWPAEQLGGTPGDIGTGINTIDWLFEPLVLRESFAFTDNSFLGHSVSTYDAKAGVWRQTWVDSKGSYLLFTGTFGDGRMALWTDPAERDGQVIQQRMVWRDITTESLNWDWQASRDGGASWTDLWNITYTRRG